MFAEVVSTLKHKNLHSMRIMACKKNSSKITNLHPNKPIKNWQSTKICPKHDSIWFYTLKHFISDLFMNKKDSLE